MEATYLVVYCTCPDTASAERIAAALVGERLAACVNIAASVRSVYCWQGEPQNDQELLLIIKTRYDVYAGLEARIQELHPYDVAEIIALPIIAGAADYLAWIDENVGVRP